MKKALFMLVPALLLITACKENCSTDGLLTVTLPDGSILYVHPTENKSAIMWAGFGWDIAQLPNKTTLATATADFAGAANTEAIVNELGNANYAAKICADLVANGCDDWYLPSAGELNAMYQQLGPYGSRDIISPGFHWSSTEYDGSNAWGQYFAIGGQGYNDKGSTNIPYPFRCRCVRR